MLHKVLRRMLRMCPGAWSLLIRLLQLSCMLLFCALLLRCRCEEDRALQFQAAALQECSQVSLLLAVLLPPCVEDLQGNGAGNRPGSSDR